MRGGFSTFKMSPQKRGRTRECRKSWEKAAFSISVTENSKALFHFSALLQAHTGNPPRLWKRNTLALLQKWACLWLFLISGFVCAAFGSSYGFVGDPQAFCLISRGGFCSAPAAICWRTPFVLPLHARFGHRSQITGNTAITGTLLFVCPTTTVSARQSQAQNLNVSQRKGGVFWRRKSEEPCKKKKFFFPLLGSAQTKIVISEFPDGHLQSPAAKLL